MNTIPPPYARSAALKDARQQALSRQQRQDVADLFRVLGNPTRVCLLRALQGRELCVCELRDLTNLTPSAISHQLRLLRAARLIKSRRVGKLIYNSLDDDHVNTLFAQALLHVSEER